MDQCRIDGCERAAFVRKMCRTHYHRWHRHGDPEKLLHPVNLSPEERFWPRVKATPEGCWEWQGNRNNVGYGLFKLNRRYVVAHRFAYEAMISEIPDGLEIDHLCRNRACVNPYHMDPVTHRVNMQRGKLALRAECGKGHPFAGENLAFTSSGSRVCVTCKRAASARYKQRVRAAAS